MTEIIFLSFIITLFITISNGEDKPCTTPNNVTGKCVPLKKCSNLYAITQLSRSLPLSVENYIGSATCKLDASTTGVCCVPEKIFELPENCGLASSERIAHGNESAVYEFPWMALLMYRKVDSNEISGDCGGALISDRYVLTAAHCLAEKPSGRSHSKLEYVRLGEHTISTEQDCINYTDSNGFFEQDCAGPVEDVRYESYAIHPGYRKAFAGDDIGLIRLEERIIFKPHIRPICLPMTAELKDALLPQYYVAGWGSTESLFKSDVLLKAILPRVDREQCQKRFDPFRQKHNITISSKQICAGSENLVDSCAGDSGGPLMWLGNYLNRPRYVLFGVVSYGVQTCGATDFPGVYARIGSYMGWILANMVA